MFKLSRAATPNQGSRHVTATPAEVAVGGSPRRAGAGLRVTPSSLTWARGRRLQPSASRAHLGGSAPLITRPRGGRGKLGPAAAASQPMAQGQAVRMRSGSTSFPPPLFPSSPRLSPNLSERLRVSSAVKKRGEPSVRARCIVGRQAAESPLGWGRHLVSVRIRCRLRGLLLLLSEPGGERPSQADARVPSRLSQVPLASRLRAGRPRPGGSAMGRSRSRSSSRSKHTKSSKHTKKNRSRSRSRSREKERARKRSKSRETKRNRRRESRSRSRSNTAPSSRRERERERASSPPDRIDIFGRTVSKRSSLDEKQKREEEEKKAEFERQRKIRQQEIEEKLIEEETARRVEELVAKRVEEELEKRKDEIEREVLRRVEEAKRIMEKQLLEELERQRQAELAAQKAREEEERAKREELERILEENNRKIAEAQAKLAEEQLKIVEEQRKIHEERMKLEQERQRQQKEEQKMILGKGKSRPKLSFSLKTQD
ncbi:arginine and glutamate-rich protein 1 [Pangshura tecta]